VSGDSPNRWSSPHGATPLARLRTRLKGRNIAAVIMEPIAMNPGVLIPDTEFMDGLVPLCHRFGTLLILDEVATGFGRTGRLFAPEYSDAQPDTMTFAKAATRGVAGIGALLVREEIAETLERDGNVYSTYGSYFVKRLRAMAFLEEPEIRARGLAIAMDVRDEKYAERVVKKCRRRGLLLDPRRACC
jgi:acetylornithine/succinyldiaminopimelate/putrescine aminotransferase